MAVNTTHGPTDKCAIFSFIKNSDLRNSNVNLGREPFIADLLVTLSQGPTFSSRDGQSTTGFPAFPGETQRVVTPYGCLITL